jgi:hypothetical protein
VGLFLFTGGHVLSAADNPVDQVAAAEHNRGADKQRNEKHWHDILLVFRAGPSTPRAGSSFQQKFAWAREQTVRRPPTNKESRMPTGSGERHGWEMDLSCATFQEKAWRMEQQIPLQP